MVGHLHNALIYTGGKELGAPHSWETTACRDAANDVHRIREVG